MVAETDHIFRRWNHYMGDPVPPSRSSFDKPTVELHYTFLKIETSSCHGEWIFNCNDAQLLLFCGMCNTSQKEGHPYKSIPDGSGSQFHHRKSSSHLLDMFPTILWDPFVKGKLVKPHGKPILSNKIAMNRVLSTFFGPKL